MIQKMKTATMQDVAKLAGVSMMTVSRVISNEAKVRDKTRDKVMAAIEELDYQPNLSARSLASAKSHLIALFYQNPSEGYVGQLLIGALSKSQSRGYNLVVSSLDETTDDVETALKALVRRNKIEGIILPPPLSDSQRVLDILMALNIPAVRISPQRDDHPFPFVCMDEAQAAFDITEHLITQGHRKIGFIQGHPDHSGSHLRYEGYKRALEKHHIDIRDDYIQQGLFTYRSGFQAAVNLVTLADPPTAIFASSDDMAAATISAAQKHHLQVPSMLSVVGFDDAPIASAIWPSLTTVRQPILEMAERATDLLIDALKKKPETEQEMETPPEQNLENILEYQLMLRETVAATTHP
ncbi:LacI family DNA-binding transcriptional regulator [Paremcibacter congregatus]|uniref:LacI family DNA-binding transcriptional regulator n=1 Tax=Paremcibacter congregatus TaxID=2043170 RepID=UPI003A8ECC95